MNAAKTPRTDQQEFHSSDALNIMVVRSEFAKQLEQELLEEQERTENLVKLIGQFDAAIRRVGTALGVECAVGVDTADQINPETGEPYGPGGHTGYILEKKAKERTCL